MPSSLFASITETSPSPPINISSSTNCEDKNVCKNPSRFNSRPRVGGRRACCELLRGEIVSIHAPAWGATRWHREQVRRVLFQFTPPRGGRLRRFMRSYRPRFQFTPPRGGRQTFETSLRRSAFQFTPPRGGRLWRRTLGHALQFQFTPPRGGRHVQPHDHSRRLGFQFTPPRGGRLYADRTLHGACEFQFTPPRGGRLNLVKAGLEITVSIHAPAWGATASSRRPP